MIRGVHAMLYTPNPDAARAFFRDQLGLPFNDVGEGWLIFDVASAEIGCHPLMPGQTGTPHEFSFGCDDIESEVETLSGRGVRFAGPVEDRGWGLATEALGPDGLKVTIYQPRYR